jgi:pyruvate carboxylase
VGDLAQFMVSNNLTPDELLKKAPELDFPSSVLEFFEGLMGQPYGGFPEPLRSQALRERRKMDKRPGLYLEPFNFDAIRKELKEKFGGCTECDVASYAMYPKVYEDYRKFTDKFGDLSVLPTKYFLNRPEIGEEFQVELEKGKVLILKLLAIGPLSDQTGQREVFYEMNGEVRQVTVDDNHAAVENKSRPKADSSDSSQVGAPMSGVVVEVRAKDGNDVQKGDPIAVLSAMKMVSSDLYCKLGIVITMLTQSPIGNGYLRSPLWQDRFARRQGGRLRRQPGLDLQDRQVNLNDVMKEDIAR